mmetsp:Transcript_15115/g.57452  ORF Transcript_15115/g.57452 Transcript_15115/m.57452 type:complete len:221 (-) Transcript_15115:2972-3634(-)|eukprot:scaffold2506_cov236-Pinguiococcus_pyrenoidosus.AAC.16
MTTSARKSRMDTRSSRQFTKSSRKSSEIGRPRSARTKKAKARGSPSSRKRSCTGSGSKTTIASVPRRILVAHFIGAVRLLSLRPMSCAGSSMMLFSRSGAGGCSQSEVWDIPSYKSASTGSRGSITPGIAGPGRFSSSSTCPSRPLLPAPVCPSSPSRSRGGTTAEGYAPPSSVVLPSSLRPVLGAPLRAWATGTPPEAAVPLASPSPSPTSSTPSTTSP